MSMKGIVETMERRQIGLYLLAIVAGGVFGWLVPSTSETLEHWINPVLGLLLYATFLGIPFAAIGRAVRDLRFIGATVTLNFVFVPLIVFGLSRFIAGDQALLVGVLLVLLTPCIDYVIVFSSLAGASSDRLLATAPILMLAQMVTLPAYLLIFIGPEVISAIDPKPFVEALVVLIIIPLVMAAMTQKLAAKSRVGRAAMATTESLMVPLMMSTLAIVVGSQIVGVGEEIASLWAVVPIYVAFLIVMVPVGLATSKIFRLDTGSTRAAVFSGATRNSLVVLPLALALPEPFTLVALVVVTQTLVELVGMVVYVKVIPRIVK